ncbi:YkvA family protein [Marinobacteraceae bacterium S3BR75-40.1]
MAKETLTTRARRLKGYSLTVYFAARDPRMPWAVRLIALLVAAYALSPVDLIPDFIPVIGYLDDLVIVPLGLALVIRLTPREVIESARERAEKAVDQPVSYGAAAFVVIVWLVVLGVGGRWLYGWWTA